MTSAGLGSKFQIEAGSGSWEAEMDQEKLSERDPQRQQANVNARFPLAAGMQLTVEIVEGRRTVMEYLLSPVQRIVSEAGMER